MDMRARAATLSTRQTTGTGEGAREHATKRPWYRIRLRAYAYIRAQGNVFAGSLTRYIRSMFLMSHRGIASAAAGPRPSLPFRLIDDFAMPVQLTIRFNFAVGCIAVIRKQRTPK